MADPLEVGPEHRADLAHKMGHIKKIERPHDAEPD